MTHRQVDSVESPSLEVAADGPPGRGGCFARRPRFAPRTGAAGVFGRVPRGWAVLALLVGALGVSTGCKSMKEVYADTLYIGETLTYDEYLSIDSDRVPPFSAAEVLGRLGKPSEVYDRDGLRRRIEYNAFSLNDELKRAEFHFDTNEELVKKELW